MQMIANDSCLLIVDVQERLISVVHSPRSVLVGCATLIQAANLIGIPIVVSEQYVRGLGQTVMDLRALAPPDSFREKTAFGCAADASIMARLGGFGRRQVITAGIETHVCVLQSALGLREKGFEVFVVAEACSSRRPESERAALARMGICGVHVVTTEMVLFEWLGSKEHLAFKAVQQLVK
ncbi:Isochorismatase [invertebrate metagenome]|uniref:Isochorismatase n=1 Tax=invertebrate metagenome TaxID=1711999 RepID=A0A484H579_9ZZZZ